MVLEMIGAIGDQIGPDRRSGEPLPQKIVDLAIGVQRAVRGVVHQDRKAELSSADNDDGEQPGQGIATPRRQADGSDADDPAVCDEPDAVPGGGLGDRRPLLAVEKAIGRQEADGGHAPV